MTDGSKIYLRHLKPVLLIAVADAVVFFFLSPWLLSEYWLLPPYLVLAGFSMVLVQREHVAYRYLDKLLLGCAVFGYLAMALVITRMRLMPMPVPYAQSPWTFSYLIERDNLIVAAVIAFIVFLSGLVGIVLKGFYVLYVSGRAKKRRAIPDSINTISENMPDNDSTRRIVKKHYRRIAEGGGCCSCSCGGRAENEQIAKSIGYSDEEIRSAGGANL